jgi:hypothetical protein
MDKWLNQLFMLLKSPVGEAEIPDVKPPLSVVDSQELGFFFTADSPRYSFCAQSFSHFASQNLRFLDFPNMRRDVGIEST